MKLFKTNNKEVIKACQEYFGLGVTVSDCDLIETKKKTEKSRFKYME